MDIMRTVLDCKPCRKCLVIGQTCLVAVGNSLRTNEKVGCVFLIRTSHVEFSSLTFYIHMTYWL